MSSLHHSVTHLTDSQRDLSHVRGCGLHAILRRESPDLAYLLGAWCSMTELGGSESSSISFTSRNPNQLALIQQRVMALLSETPPLQGSVIQGVPYLRLTIHASEVTRHMHEVTSGNTRIPGEHLATEGECKSFLGGIFDHGGWVYTGPQGGIGLNKKGGDALLEDMCRVFARLGIFPIVVYGKVPSLKLKDLAEWRAFAERIELSLPERREAVNTLANRVSPRTHYGEEEYASVLSLANTTSLTYREIGAATGIPMNTVRSWLCYGQKPPAVKRADIIEGFSVTRGVPEVIHVVYRALGGSSRLARECGGCGALQTLAHTLPLAIEARERIYGNDEQIRALLIRTPTTDL